MEVTPLLSIFLHNDFDKRLIDVTTSKPTAELDAWDTAAHKHSGQQEEAAEKERIGNHCESLGLPGMIPIVKSETRIRMRESEWLRETRCWRRVLETTGVGSVGRGGKEGNND